MNPFDILRSLYARWIAKSPNNARIATNVLTICTIIIAAPAALDYFHVAVPQIFAPYVSWLIAAATAIAAIIAKLQVDSSNSFDNQKNQP